MTMNRDELTQRRIDKQRAARPTFAEAAREFAAAMAAAARATRAMSAALRAGNDSHR